MTLTLVVFMILVPGYIAGQFAGNNIALKQNATQLPGDYCDTICYNASLAVDGEVDSDGHLRGHCSHTTGNSHFNASWEVSFRGLYQITGIRVSNRKSTDSDLLGKRLRNFSVIGINSNTSTGIGINANTTTEQLLYTDNYTFISENYKVITEIPLPNPPSVTGIRIEIPNRGDEETTVLTLCEVEVYSDFVCPNLTRNNNTIISYTNYANNGSVASFSCVPGYYLSRNNYTIACQIYQWSGPPAICQKVYCPLPSNISNGGYSISDWCTSLEQNNSLPYNCSVSLFCNKGFYLTERKEWVCLENGSWSGKEPVCQIVMCILPDKDQNGIQLHATFSNGSYITTNSISYGTEIQMFCKAGFKTHTKIKITCQENGLWNGTTPVCNVVTCDHPGNKSVINGNYTDEADTLYLSGKKNYSQTIKVVCTSGFVVTSGSETRICEDNGTWSGIDRVCTIVKCSPLEKVEGVFYEYSFNNRSNIYHLNATVNISCDNGMIPEGSTVRRCIANGTWDGIPSNCNAASPSSNPRAALIGGVTGAVVVLLIVTVIVVVVVVIIMRRRALLSKNSKQESQITFNELRGNKGDITLTSKATENQDKRSSSQIKSDNEYYAFDEVANDIPKTAIHVKDLSDLIFTGDNAADRFRKEFDKLPKGMQEQHLEALKPQNRGKNRYKDLYAYDSTRVVLDKDSETESDYINACYIHGYNKVQAYIASQGPTKEILIDFWRMVWQTKCSKIVMLTNLVELGKPKCEQYWPGEDSIQYGDVLVTMKDVDIFSEFIIRKFEIKKGNLTEKEVLQFHFTAWPDKGVPKYASSLVQFRNKVKYAQINNEGPMVVHCSAGVGRTGTFIALDYLTEEAKVLGYVDVYGCVETLRRQRVNLVQMLEQYTFLHHALLETLMLSSSALPSSKFQAGYQNLLEIDTQTKTRKIDQEFEMLKKLSPVTAENQYLSAKDVKNRHKNRYSNILPVDEFMPRCTSGQSEEDNYVNAVFLPSYKEKTAFIITQTPLESTRSDFLRLVWEHNIHTIVMMNSVSEMQEGEIYWPVGKDTIQFDNVSVSSDSKMSVDQHIVMTLTASFLAQSRKIKLIQCGGWSSGSSLPESPKGVLSLLELVQSWQQKTGNQKILVHCMNGAEKSGLFCVVSAVIDRMKIEQDVAISHTIEEMRNAREQIIPSVAQYQFCHEAVLAYIQMNDTYSNFTI